MYSVVSNTRGRINKSSKNDHVMEEGPGDDKVDEILNMNGDVRFEQKKQIPKWLWEGRGRGMALCCSTSLTHSIFWAPALECKNKTKWPSYFKECRKKEPFTGDGF